MVRVVNSLGPFFSASKSMARRVGNRVDWMVESSWRAREVVHNAFKQSKVSWSSASSWSSLHSFVSMTELENSICRIPKHTSTRLE